jgi:DNA-binding SARP family transcriptional activator/Flp pilus assembly protein TadD
MPQGHSHYHVERSVGQSLGGVLAMQFRVLGPLQTRTSDGELVQLGAAKQRALLSMLLLHPNAPVGVDRLVEALWPTRRPPSVTSALRTYVSSLRQSLRLTGRPPAPALLARAGAYLIQLEPADLDLLVFEDLAASGQLALADGDTATAVERLQVALALWRGRPLEDVPLNHECDLLLAGLEERRREVLDDCVAARLALGHHDQLATELRAWVLAEPLHELLWGHWMLALYRSGRQAEALAAYQELQDVLDRELGVAPASPVRELRRRILAADPTLDPPPRGAVAVTAAPRVVPRQVPPDISGFTGRCAESATLRELLRPVDPPGPMSIATINGIAGVGKSALAVHAAHVVADRFPDGQLYADLAAGTPGVSPLAPEVVLGRFLRALGVGDQDIPSTPEDASARFREVTAGRRLLVVLDNARDSVHVRPLLPTSPSCAVIVTSRQVLSTLDGATPLRLDALSSDEAVDLLGRLAGRHRCADDPDAADQVARLCACLPLAVRIAGARLAARPSWPMRVMADRLTDAQRRLDELQVADLGVRASFQLGYYLLAASPDDQDRAAARAFPLLALLDGPDVGVPVVARLLDQPEPAAEAALERLVDSQLLGSEAPGRYRLHDLVRLYAREESARRHTGPERTAALTRALDWYVAMAWQAFRLLRPGDQRLARMGERWAASPGHDLTTAAAATAWLEVEHGNLVAAVDQAASAPDLTPEIAVQLAEALFGFFLVRGHWHEWQHVHRTAREVARRTGDRRAEAHACRDLSTACERLGQYDLALRHLEESLAIFDELDDVYGRATALNGLGVVHYRLGQHELAVRRYGESVAIRRELDDPYGLAVGLANLGMVHVVRGDFGRALGYQQEALAIFERLGERNSQAVSLTALGEAYEGQGQLGQALACHERSLAISRADGNLAGEGTALNNLGRLLLRRGQHAKALACHRRALSINEELGERYEQADALRHLGAVRHDLGQDEEARRYWQRALDIFDDLGVSAAGEVRALLDKSAEG